MAGKRWQLVSYDIRDEKRLRKVAKLLQGYGTRLQYSVFRCHLSDRDLERLRWELTRIMTKEDDLLVVSLCNSCVARVRATNPDGQWPEEPPGFIII